MADFHRVDQVMTSEQDVIDEILGFLTTSGPGPGWTEDSTYTATSNPGELLLSSAGSTTFFVYISGASGSGKVQAWYLPDTANGFGSGSGPSNHKQGSRAFFTMDTAEQDYVLHLFADEDRCVAILKGSIKEGTEQSGFNDRPAVNYQVIYFGGYVPHAASGDDPYPLVLAGNGTDFSTVPPEQLSLQLQSGAPESHTLLGFFPSGIGKRIGSDEEYFTSDLLPERSGGWEASLRQDFTPPRNSRGSEIFAFQQGAYVVVNGKEESFSFTGMFLTHSDVGLEQDVTVNGSTHFSFPAFVRTYQPGVRSVGRMAYVVPKGTAV